MKKIVQKRIQPPLYNEKLKKQFLQTLINENTRKTYETVLRSCSSIEKENGKDLCEFVFSEYEEILYNFRSKTINSLYSKFSCLKSYELFCSENNHIPPGKILNHSFISRDSLNKYLSKLKTLLTEQEILDLIEENKKINLQDSAILLLLFLGIKSKENSEIVNLKVSDLEEERINIRNEEGEIVRVVETTKENIQLLRLANKQEIYNRRIELSYDESKNVEKQELLESGKMELRLGFSNWVIKQSPILDNNGNLREENTPVNPAIIDFRCKRALKEKYPLCTATSIYQSSILNAIYEKYKEKGNKKLEFQEYSEILSTKYGLEKISNIAPLRELFESKYLQLMEEEDKNK